MQSLLRSRLREPGDIPMSSEIRRSAYWQVAVWSGVISVD
jgi:hypothetical protein